MDHFCFQFPAVILKSSANSPALLSVAYSSHLTVFMSSAPGEKNYVLEIQSVVFES